MKAAPLQEALCSTCGTTLNAKGECLVCLVRLGFDRLEESPLPVFGDYEVARREDGSLWELGHGAMGVTYRAEDKVLNRTVALKVVTAPTALGAGQAVRDRFLREARAAAALRHPNVAGVFSFGASSEGYRCYYAMELVEGETLEVLVRRDGPLKVEMALEMAVQVTRALVAAAAHGLVHRDLKPGNMMLTRADAGIHELEVKVIDFGLAKSIANGNEIDLTHGAFVGTPAFASPEQFSGAPADARSDIYSLGATLWYALTGEAPYGGKSIDEVRRGQSEEALPTEKLVARKTPKAVIQLLRRTLALNPTERPSSARELMGALEHCRARLGYTRPNESNAGTPRKLFALAAALALAAVAFFALRLSSHKQALLISAPPKSIAVLPFQNLSDDQQNAYLSGGVQEEILTSLAKVADLKVICRASVMQFRDAEKRNLREIARQLGVVHVLEGSVQRSANRIRVTAQLIDTRTDAHVWADRYDGDLANVFAIQSEIARAVADQLQAKLSPRERAEIQRPPTTDMAAFDLYHRAGDLLTATSFGTSSRPNTLEAIDLLTQAVARDPSFFGAYCRLASAHLWLYSQRHDHTPARLALADEAIRTAFRLRPDAGEAHLARANYLYRRLDYDGALAELDVARKTLPNEGAVFQVTGYIRRRQGKREEGLRNLERALEIDPRSVGLLQQIAISYNTLRRYASEAATLDRILAIKPDDIGTKIIRGQVEFEWKADTRPFHQAIDSILAASPDAIGPVAGNWLLCAMAERDTVAAGHALAALEKNGGVFPGNGIHFNRAMCEGLIARMANDPAAARIAFTAARLEQEGIVRAQPEDGPALSVLALIDAGLGRKEEALREGRRAIELLPVEKDAVIGDLLVVHFAIAAGWVGEKDLAIEQLRHVAHTSYGDLKLDPDWDALRGDPRFEAIVASLAPKSNAPQ
jgi:serine/threonine protein kinase/Tfp pilus assembly protein PilF